MPNPIGYWNSSTGVSALPQNAAVRPVSADPVPQLAEKVRAATLAGRVNFLPYLDPYTHETEAMRRIYPLMMSNGVVKQALQTKVNSVAALDLQTTPATDSARDHEVADFVRYAYTVAIEGSFHGIAQEILMPGLIYKNSVSELVWHEDLWQRGRFTGKHFFRAVKAKEYAQIIQDEFRNVVGVRALGFGQAETFRPDDFAIFFHNRLFHGAGTSDLRAAYQALWYLDTCEKLHLIHLEKFLSPVVAVSYGDGFPIDQKPGLEADVAAVRSRGWLIVPESVKVDALQLAVRGEAEFLEKCRDLREQIALSIAGAFLQMLTAGGAQDIRGDSKTQQSTSELLVWALAASLTDIINTQVTPRLIGENYRGVDYPMVSLGGINYAEQMQAMELARLAQQAGAKLSLRAFSRQFNLQLATDPSDTLVPPDQQQAQPMPGLPPAAGVLPRRFGDRRDFCGGKGGKPGPCPSGERWKEATEAMTAAHPFPTGPEPERPAGAGNPRMLAADPALREAAQRYAAHTAAYHRAYAAHATRRMLTEPAPRPVPLPGEGASKGKRVAAARKAIDAAEAAAADVTTFGPAFAAHHEAIAQAHPDAPAAIEAAAKTAASRHKAALAVAKEHIAGLPEGTRERASRLLFGQHFADGAHSPRGGVNIQGTFYKGGEFIPGSVMAKATKAERAAVKGKGARPREGHGRGSKGKGKSGEAKPGAAGADKSRAPPGSSVASYPRPAAKNGRDAEASGLPARGKKAQNTAPWNPDEKAKEIATILKDADGGKPGSWTQANATTMERLFASALNFDWWGGTYPADIAGVVKINGKPTRVGIDLKTAVTRADGGIKKDDNAESLKIGFVTEEPDQKGFGKAASLSGNPNAAVRSLMFHLAVNANHTVKEIPAVGPNGRHLKDSSGQPVMQKAGLLYLQAGVRGSNYKHMIPVDVKGLNDVSDLTKPDVLARVREKILEEIKKTDASAFAETVKDAGEALHTRMVRARSRQDASLADAGVKLDATGTAQAEAGKALKAKEKAQAKARELAKQVREKDQQVDLMRRALQGDKDAKKQLKDLGIL